MLLASAAYDPAGAVTKATDTAAVMAALDTTNLRLAFTAPPNGAVLVRQRSVVHGATTFPQTLFGVLEGSTVKSRIAPLGGLVATALATQRLGLEALYVVPGLTPGAALTWDAAYGVETVVASTGIKYGGPNNTTTNDAFGAYLFEIYDAPNLIGAITYDPAGAVSKATSSLLAMTAFDTTNARIAFVAPTSKVLWRVRCNLSGATTFPSVLLGVLSGAAVVGRSPAVGGIPGTNLATTNVALEGSGIISVTRGASLTYDAAYGVEIVLALTNIHYGGPDNTTANDAWGALQFELWAV